MVSSNRRDFLKGLGVLAAAPVAGGCASSVPGISAGRSPNGRLRVAVIGCGGIGKSTDIPGMAAHKAVEMAAFCDVDANYLAQARRSSRRRGSTATGANCWPPRATASTR